MAPIDKEGRKCEHPDHSAMKMIDTFSLIAPSWREILSSLGDIYGKI
jgi:hypothetical protein